MSEITETTMSASDVFAAIDQFDDAIYDEIIKRINFNRSERKSENARQIADLEKQINALKAKSPNNTRTYGQIVNPNNPSEIYRTGGYTDWLKNMAKAEGVDIYDTKKMKEWIQEKKA